MPTVTYQYIPIYGIEKYLAPSATIAGLGGAEETNDNLLISLWRGVFGANPLPDITDLFVPFYANEGGNPPESLAAAYEPNMKSRVSARLFYNQDQFVKVDQAIAVLNPPQEYKQQMVGAITRTGDIVADPIEVALQVNRPLQCNFAWRSRFDEAGDFNVFTSPGASNAIWGFSTYLPTANPFPFLKTNGANGVAPEWFDTTTNDGWDEMIAAVNQGNFYVAFIFSGDPFGASGNGNPGQVEIEWPHTTGRS